MDKKTKALKLLIEQAILPQYFHPDPDTSVQILKALYQSGIRAIEYSDRDEKAINNFLVLRKVADKELPGLQLGVGNIRNKIAATEYINEGASFIICPCVAAEIGALAKNNNLLWVPGCLTATEIALADDLGAQLVRLHPANLLGPSYLKAMKEVFPDILFMPAGGIETNEGNMESWFKNGATALELGLNLIGKNLMETNDYELIGSSAKQTLEMVKKIKSQ